VRGSWSGHNGAEGYAAIPPGPGVGLDGGVAVGEGETVAVVEATADPVDITVTYAGILPDLFREGQGIIANGRLNQTGIFQADEVLAKHDENYMPKEVADALKDAGVKMDYRTHAPAP